MSFTGPVLAQLMLMIALSSAEAWLAVYIQFGAVIGVVIGVLVYTSCGERIPGWKEAGVHGHLCTGIQQCNFGIQHLFGSRAYGGSHNSGRSSWRSYCRYYCIQCSCM